MPERTPKLSAMAVGVFKASRVLSVPVKWVGTEDWLLDNGGPKGSYVSAAVLAIRLGMAKDSVEEHRRTLQRYGLYCVIQLRGQGNPNGWVLWLPEHFIPVGARRVPDAEIAVYAHRFDEYLEAIRDGTITVLNPATGGVVNPATSGVLKAAIGGVVRHTTPVVGGKGGSPSHFSHPQEGTYVPSPSVVKGEEGDVAKATRRVRGTEGERRDTGT